MEAIKIHEIWKKMIGMNANARCIQNFARNVMWEYQKNTNNPQIQSGFFIDLATNEQISTRQTKRLKFKRGIYLLEVADDGKVP